jgi:hypothetical protein
MMAYVPLLQRKINLRRRSEPTTTAGYVFWISVPVVGSKLTGQISPVVV